MYIGVRATARMDSDWGQGDVRVLFTLFILTDWMEMGGLLSFAFWSFAYSIISMAWGLALVCIKNEKE